MANKEHLRIIKQGVGAWNNWRRRNPKVKPDLRKANLRKANLRKADLSEADLSEADLSWADLSDGDLRKAQFFRAFLSGANLSAVNLSEAMLLEARFFRACLSEANLRGAYLSQANFIMADLSKADLSKAELSGANLSAADLYGANLSEAKLIQAILVETLLENADLSGCHIYGISAWNLKLDEKTKQSNLIITRQDEPSITVDNLEVAQFIYLLLHNEKIRQVIDTITTKVVLILGRFTLQRKGILDAIREELRRRDYIPVLFEFNKPGSKDTRETITTLARLARFVIADITEPKSIPQELVSIVESLPSLAVQPLLQEGHEPWAMIDHIKRYPWVLAIHRYRDLDDLLSSLQEKVIEPAEAKVKELGEKKVK